MYAYQQADNKNVSKGSDELLLSLEKVHDLYLYYLTFLTELVHVAERRIEEGKQKKLPTPEDLDPKLRFVENQVLRKLILSPELRQSAEKRKINWIGEQELPRAIFNVIKESAMYQKYMHQAKGTFEDEKKFVEDIFREYIANSEDLLVWFEEKSIFWLDDIDMVCNMVIRTIRECQENQSDIAIFSLYKDPVDDVEFVKRLYIRTIGTVPEADAVIDDKARNWDLERIAIIDRILMRMAITEAREFPSIPVKVSLNEYIEISKFYSTPKSNGFINGILDRVFIELRQKGLIKKTGRGLIE